MYMIDTNTTAKRVITLLYLPVSVGLGVEQCGGTEYSKFLPPISLLLSLQLLGNRRWCWGAVGHRQRSVR